MIDGARHPIGGSVSISLIQAVFVATATGCHWDKAPEQPEQRALTRDSSGVVITESLAANDELPAGFSIAEKPALDLGGPREPPDHELGPGDHAWARLSDGSIAVAERSDVKIFDSNGRFVRTIGRAGFGPGTFNFVYGVCVAPGDRIVGIAGRRVSIFDSSGNHVNSFTTGLGEFARFGCFEDGSLLALAKSKTDARAHGWGTAVARRVHIDGSEPHEFGSVPAGAILAGALFPTVATVLPHGKYVYVGDGRRPEVKMYTSEGQLVRLIRWRGRQMPLTAELLRRIGNAVYPDVHPDSVAARIDRVRPNLPAELPAYATMLVDDADRIWVQDYYLGRLLGNFPPQWTVISADGQVLGRVSLPAIQGAKRMDLRSVSRNQAALTWSDSIGFPHLSFHEILPAR